MPHLIVALLLLVPTASFAQRLRPPIQPRIGYVYPAGGQQGTTFEITLGGQFLAGAHDVILSGTGAQATLVKLELPPSPREQQDLRDQWAILQARRQVMRGGPRPAILSNYTGQIEWTPADEKRADEIRRKLDLFQKRRNTPSLSEFATVRITLAPDAPPGEREIRLLCSSGLSNPLVFHVGQLTEFAERDNVTAGTKTGLSVTLPCILNGQIMPGEVDRYRFSAKKGQHLTTAVLARALIPYLPDAVPGWFQATLTLKNAQGKELAYTDDFRFQPDPVLSYEIPADGEYVIEITDSIYRGREDFVYRVTIGELPFVTHIFPLGCQIGTQTNVAVYGWNLPVTTLLADARNKTPGVYPLFVWKDARFSNLVPFATDTLPEMYEREQPDPPPVLLPIIVNGRIDAPGDVDRFRFDAKAGQEIVAEIIARRLHSPVDSLLRVTDAAGRQLAVNDDHEDKGAGLTTHHADSYLRFTVPADGTYLVHVSDTQGKGGSEYAYRLRLSAPRPDFELRVAPSSVCARSDVGGSVTVWALRRDGFTGPINVALKNPPPDFWLQGVLPADKDHVKLTLTVPAQPPSEPLVLEIEGRAQIDGVEVTRIAVPAEDMMQAFLYKHLVPAKELRVVVQPGRPGVARR